MPPRDLYQAGSAYHTARRRYAPAAIRCAALAMEHLGTPGSLLDVGCGEDAAVVAWCQAAGIDACGVDLAVPDTPAAGLVTWDLRQPLMGPFTWPRVFDWVLCWEVAEHLPAESAETLCDSLVRHVARPNGRVIFTAARPGQRGPGHIHCQQPDYWRWLLTDRGLSWLSRDSASLATCWRDGVPTAPWYANNVQVFAWA